VSTVKKDIYFCRICSFFYSFMFSRVKTADFNVWLHFSKT